MSENSDPDVCEPSARSSSEESKDSNASSGKTMDSPVLVPGSPLSFLQSCEPDANDTSQLAEPPEHLPPEQVESCQDTLENPQKTDSVTSISCGNDSERSNVPDCGESDGNPQHDEVPYTSTASDASSSVSQSCGDSNSGPMQNVEPSQLISKEPLFKVPTRKEASDFQGILPPVFPYACVLCNITVLTEKVWLWHVRGAQHGQSQLELLKKYPEWDKNVESAKRNESQAPLPAPVTKKKADRIPKVPTRKEAADFQGRAPPVFPDECVLCNFTVFSEEEWLEHICSALHAKSQLDLVERYPGWDQTIESTKRNEWQGKSRARNLDRTDPIYKVPTRKEASDYHGKVPPVFPNQCILCDITVHSERGWSVHTTGARHAASQVRLLERYPGWDQSIRSARRNECQKTTEATFSKRRGSSPQEWRKKHSSNMDKTSSMKTTAKDHGKVVCVTFEANAVEEGYLKKLLREFGDLVKIAMFPTMALVEMGKKDQSEDIVKYYKHYPLVVHGKQIEFSSSTISSLLEISRVVSFTPLPPGEGTTAELMAIAKRFGSVKNSLFLPGRGYVEMTELTDAKTLVEHFSSKPIKLKKKTIHVNFSSEFESLEVTQVDDKALSPRSHSRRSSSPGSHSSESGSPSPKRRRSTERACSLRSSCSKEQEDRHDYWERPETTSAKKSSVSTCSSTKDEGRKSSDYSDKILIATMDSDSDLEGLEVIADDEEEFLEYDEIIDDQMMDQEQESFEISLLDGQPTTTNQNTTAGEEVKQLTSNSQKKDQKTQDEDVDTEEEDFDFPESLENCITLDELEDSSSDFEELNRQNSSAQKDKSTVKDVTETLSLPVHKSYMEKGTKQSPSLKQGTSRTAKNKTSYKQSVKITDQCTEKLDMETNGIKKKKYGKVLDVRNLPKAEEFTDVDFVNIAKRYGKVKHFWLIHSCNRGFIEMVHSSDAERIAADSKKQNLALHGNILKIKVSEKYSSLPTAGFNVDYDSDDEENAKRENCRDSSNNQSDVVAELTAVSSNEPQKPNEPVGTEFVRPILGYICNLCNVIYASEEEAKEKHCRSQSHHEKLKKHHENAFA